MSFATNCLQVASEEPKLRWNKAESNLRHFRTIKDISSKSNLTQFGIEDKFISGSGQFTKENIQKLSEKVQQVSQNLEKLIVIDLRMESHGFINGLPVTWKVENGDDNIQMSPQEIILKEKK